MGSRQPGSSWLPAMLCTESVSRRKGFPTANTIVALRKTLGLDAARPSRRGRDRVSWQLAALERQDKQWRRGRDWLTSGLPKVEEADVRHSIRPAQSLRSLHA